MSKRGTLDGRDCHCLCVGLADALRCVEEKLMEAVAGMQGGGSELCVMFDSFTVRTSLFMSHTMLLYYEIMRACCIL